METLSRPSYQNSDRKYSVLLVRNANSTQNLKPGQGFVNDWLTVTNWIPPVNEA